MPPDMGGIFFISLGQYPVFASDARLFKQRGDCRAARKYAKKTKKLYAPRSSQLFFRDYAGNMWYNEGTKGADSKRA